MRRSELTHCLLCYAWPHSLRCGHVLPLTSRALSALAVPSLIGGHHLSIHAPRHAAGTRGETGAPGVRPLANGVRARKRHKEAK